MKTRIIYGLLAGLCFSLYWLTWRGAILFAGILGAYLLVYFFNFYMRQGRTKHLVAIGAIVAVGLVGFHLLGYPIPTIFTGQTAQATSELASFNILLATHSFSVLTLLVPVMLVLLAYQVVKRGGASLTLLLVWSVIILVITVMYWRFAYYFAVNVALLTGWFIWYTWQKLARRDTLVAIMVVGVLCAVAVIPNIQQATASKSYHTPSDAWCESLEWVRDNTPPNAVILSWWDYGYWISRIGQRKSYINPGQDPERITNTASYFLSPSGETSIDFDYLILDYSTITSKFRGITIWAGEPAEKYFPQAFPTDKLQVNNSEYYKTLIVRLYTEEPVFTAGKYVLVYQSEQEIEGIPEVKVFYKRLGVIDGQ